jgi:sugar phosphate isomerase/epimerase
MTSDTEPTSTSQGGVICGLAVGAWPTMLEQRLREAIDAGFTAVELSVSGLHCVLGGRLVERNTARIADICERYADSLTYSVHSPAVLDLRDQSDPALHQDILLACTQFTGAIGGKVLVVHYEARSEDAGIERQYRAAIEQAAEVAGELQVILGIENIEVERSERVVEFVDSMRHPFVRMTYDFAHNYLAGNLFGYDHVAAAEVCAPYTAHLHLTDNFGRFNKARLGDFNLYRAIPYSNIIVAGLGDLHLPIGLGTLPFEQVYAPFAAAGYSGLLISEHEQGPFSDMDAEVCRALRALVLSQA